MNHPSTTSKTDCFHAMEPYDDDNASDGAWWAMLENAVTFFNEQNGTKYDECDTVHEYLAWKHPSTIERESNA